MHKSKWLVAIFFPQLALANTGPLPLAIYLIAASVFLIIPVVAIYVTIKIFLAWRKGLLGRVWVLSSMLAVALGVVVLWLQFIFPGLHDFTNWPIVYLALIPVLVVWAASTKVVKHAASLKPKILSK